LRGWYAVGLGPERLGLMAFSLAPVGSRRFFFTIASIARSLCTLMMNKTKYMKQKKQKKTSDLGQATRNPPPPPDILLQRTPSFAYGTPFHHSPPTLSPYGDHSHSPRRPGSGSCHLPCQHYLPSGTSLRLSFGRAVTPPRFPGGNLL